MWGRKRNNADKASQIATPRTANSGNDDEDEDDDKNVQVFQIKDNSEQNTASFMDTLSFVFDEDGAEDDKSAVHDKDSNKTNHSWSCCTATGKSRMKLIFAAGVLGSVLNGLIYPAIAFVFASSLSDLAGVTANLSLEPLAGMAYKFMGVGVAALVFGLTQGWCFEIVAHRGAQNFSKRWFQALLRQDAAFFDVYDVAALSGQIGPNALAYQRGVGRKLGEALQFLTTAIGGLVFAFYSSWRVALVILIVFPVVAAGAMATQYYNVTASQRAAKHYERAGGVSYAAVSAIKTVLSLNAVPEMIRQYSEATYAAYSQAVFFLAKKGFANASFTASFLILYTIITLYGSSLLYKAVAQIGCDPSASVDGNETCGDSAAQIFAAMMGVSFAAQGVANGGNCLGMIEDARVAAYKALQAIRRKPGADGEIIYDDTEEEEGASEDEDQTIEEADSPRRTSRRRSSRRRRRSSSRGRRRSRSRSRQRRSTIMSFDVEEVLAEDGRRVKGVLPKYEIDSTSNTGAKPTNVQGAISIKNVHFSYPTRPNTQVFNGISTEIEAGSIVAFVGPSGGGKSTVVSLLERFYDPQTGSIELDGVNLKDMNVQHLRSLIGFVGQEPTLFATTIRHNIQYGNPHATTEQIEEAARLANAHDFIMSFSEGYDTQVGDKGSQLSGGQKQRIAIARILVGNPKILLLDEATSALDAESELVVQEALDNIIAHKKITTIIVAHRLSTIRHASKINVIVAGRLVESGTHAELMASASYYRKLVNKQEGVDDEDEVNSSRESSRENSVLDLTLLDEPISDKGAPHIAFNNVCFAYPTRPKKNVLDNFNLSIQPGETVALVGPSGGGKSTVVGLLERFYDPKAGTVEYHGEEISGLNVAWYRQKIGFVGQEPTLFNDTIARNIAYGASGVLQTDVEVACRQANAHEFITGFPDGYETSVGQRGTALSGGQKQRVAIARALVRKPELLILDEATSALDNESEAIVQAAINDLMASRSQTVIVIAHRLSTIRNADKIAFIANGRVLEFGSHDELIQRPNGRYSRLVESSKRKSSVSSVGLRKAARKRSKSNEADEEDEEIIDWEAEAEAEAAKSFDLRRAREMARPDFCFIGSGALGALMGGGVFPLWGLLFSEMVGLLFQRVEVCPATDGTLPYGFETCEMYWDNFAYDMQQRSFQVASYWAALVAMSIVGTVLSVWSFGMASERLNKRVRDSTFEALLRQEVAYFDKRSVGGLTSQLQDDAARIHLFTDEPIRQVCVALASVVIGVLLSFIYMWPFALLAIATLPMMMFAVSQRMKQHLGSDQGVYVADELNSPGGIIVETLLNIRTVSALTLEKQRMEEFNKASQQLDEGHELRGFIDGLSGALGMFVRQWIMALQFWFGGWLMFTYPELFSFQDFLIANFAIMFSLFGLASAFQDMADQKEMKESAGRIFALLDRQSDIDPLSKEGKTL